MSYDTWLLDTTCTAFARTCATLADPRVDDIPRALRLMTPLADALEGFAIGCVIMHVVTAAGAHVSPVATSDDLLSLRLAAEIEVGWQHYRSALAGAVLPTTSPLWCAWGRKIRGDRNVEIRDHILFVA